MNQRRVSRLEVHAIPLDAATSLVFSRLYETVVRPQWCNITTPTNSCQATEKGPSPLLRHVARAAAHLERRRDARVVDRHGHAEACVQQHVAVEHPDAAVVAHEVRMILDASEGIHVVGEAADGEAAVGAARRLKPDVVLMDVRMPRLDGLEATRRLAGPGVAEPARVLILTTFDLDAYVYEALRAGASGFLLKDLPREDLVAAVRVVAGGDAL